MVTKIDKSVFFRPPPLPSGSEAVGKSSILWNPGGGQHGTRLPACSRVPSCRTGRVSFVCLASPQEARSWHCPVARPWIPAKASPEVGVQAGPPSPAQQRQEAPGRERARPRLSPKSGGLTQRIVWVSGWPSGLLRLRGEGSVRGGGGMGGGGWRPAGSPSPSAVAFPGSASLCHSLPELTIYSPTLPGQLPLPGSPPPLPPAFSPSSFPPPLPPLPVPRLRPRANGQSLRQ